MAYKTVSPQQLKEWIDKKECVLIDVREPAEHKAANIKQAKLLPLSNVTRENLPDLDGKKLVVHCHSGKRAGMACAKLLTEDPNLEIYNLEGGIMSWEQEGQDVKRSGKFFLPVDRQVQLTAGSFVLLGVLLGYFIHPGFLVISGFFGAGLMFAGLSGSCGMAMLLAKMPWNRSGD